MKVMMMKSAVNALYKLLWNLDHYCPHEMFPDTERFVIEVSTGPTTCGWRIVISLIIRWNFPSCYDSVMRDLVVLFIHFIASLARLLGPWGARSLVAESLLLKHQLLILNRSRQRAPNLSASDRIFAGWRSGCVPLACFD